MARRVIDEPSEDVVARARQERAETRRNPFARIVLFMRQVFGELRKVVTPTRSELIGYTIVVLGFVVVMMALVYGLDQAFGWLVTLVLGNGQFAGS